MKSLYYFSNDIKKVILNYIFFKPKNNNELYNAVNLWCLNKVKAKYIYGDINDWDTSLITNMSRLFYNHIDFNNCLK